MIRRILAAATAGLVLAGGWVNPAQAAATGTVTGTFVTPAGEPIEGAKITVTASPSARLLGETVTDAAGHWTLPGLPPGGIKVMLDDAGFVQVAHQKRYLSDGTVFTVPDGGTVTVDETQLPGGTVTGTYRTAAGDPINGADVYAYSAANRVTGWGRTGPDGGYRLVGVEPGQVKINFLRNGQSQWAHQAADYASATAFTVTADETIVVDETQRSTARITGVVSAATGGPAEVIEVAAEQVGGTGWIKGDLTAGGGYTIDVPPGRWVVTVESAPVGIQYIPQAAKRADATVFTVTAGQTVRADETLLPLGAVQGVMRWSNGDVVYDRSVTLWRDGAKVKSVYTDDDGFYRFQGLQPGGYLISRDNGDGSQTYIPGTLRPERAETIPERAGEVTVRDFQQPQPATLRGRLTLAHGTPLPGFSVSSGTVPGDHQRGLATTDANGEWAITTVFPGEDYQVKIQNPARDRTQVVPGTFTLRPGETATVDQVWQSGGAALRVTALDDTTGQAITGFCASVVGRTGTYCTDGTQVTAAGLAPGAVTVTVTAGDYYLADAKASATLVDGQTATATVRPALGGRIHVEVADRETGTARKQWCVVLATPGEGGVPDGDNVGCTRKNGAVTSAAVPDGTYQMFVYSTDPQGLGAQWVGENGGTGDQRQAAKIKIKVGKTTRPPTILLDKGGDLRGIVRNTAGAPVEDVAVDVNAWPLDTDPPFSGTFSDGSYRIYSLGPYAWPLIFTSKTGTAPRQISGTTGNRFQAATVTVSPGATTAYDYTLAAGSRLTGTVTAGRPFTSGRITAVNSATGDVLAQATFTSQNPTYDMPVIGGGSVILRWSLTGGGADATGSWPDKVSVPKSGAKTVDLTI